MWSCELSLGSGDAAKIVWTADNREVEVGIGAEAWVEDIYGYKGRPGVSRLIVKGDPVLIVAIDAASKSWMN